MYYHYERVDAPNYRYGFRPPPTPQLAQQEINIDAPNYKPYTPTYAPKTVTPQLIKQIAILEDKEIYVPPMNSGKNYIQPVSITWEQTRTTITRANLTIRAYSEGSSMALAVFLNDLDQEIGGVGWDWSQGGTWQSKTIDVTGRLANGVNNFKADYFITSGVNVTGTRTWVFLDLTLEYLGDEPGTKVDPPPPDPTALLWAVGLVGAGIIAYKYVFQPAMKGGLSKWL